MIRTLLAAFALATWVAGPAIAQYSFVVPKPGDPPSADMVIQPDSACGLVQQPVRFCGMAPDFVLTPQFENPEIVAFYTTPSGVSALFIVENLGTDDGLTIASVQDTALGILAATMGVSPRQIPVLERRDYPVDGVMHPNMVYLGRIDGADLVYSNTFVLAATTIVQLITFETGVAELTDIHRTVHADFIGMTRIEN